MDTALKLALSYTCMKESNDEGSHKPPHTHTCRCFIIDFHTFKLNRPSAWDVPCFSVPPKDAETEKLLDFHAFTQGSLVCEIIASFKGFHLIIIALLWCILWGRKMCLIAGVRWHGYPHVCVRVSFFPVFPKVTRVIYFPFAPAALIDDHSLFHANTLLLSRVHYSKTVTLGKRGRPVGKHYSFHALHKVTVGKRGPSSILKTPLRYRMWNLVES